MKYKIKNGSHRGKAFKVPGALAAVKAGEEVELDLERELSDDDIAKLAADGVKITLAGKKSSEKPAEKPAE